MLGNIGLAIIFILALTSVAAPLENYHPIFPASKALQTRNNGLYLKTHKPVVFASSHAPSKSSPHTVRLKKRMLKRPNTRSAGHHLNKRSQTSGTGTLKALQMGSEYATSMVFGNQTFEVVVDTGSSDTWVPQAGFMCYDENTYDRVPTSNCGFGPQLYKPSSTFKKIPGEEFHVIYGDGESGSGYTGNESVTLAGVTVNQKVGIMDKAAWSGENITSGLVGLSYPEITGATSNVSNEKHIYDPIFTTMYKQGLVDSYFSLAISRNVSGDGGYLTLGGLPPIDFEESWTSTDILITNIEGSDQGLKFYTININDITVDGKIVANSGGKKNQYIVDSGTTYNRYPNATAKAVNDAFRPPAVMQDDGTFSVDCGAIAPAHSITINGTSFGISPLDMIALRGQDDDGNILCQTQITAGGADPHQQTYILGDTFLKNVVAVFDVGAAEMRFAPNMDYESNNIL